MKTFTKLLSTSVLVALLSLPLTSFAAVECTKEKANWIDKTKFQTDLKAEGYEIKEFKVTKGNCYEIYGKNKEGKKVEIYFNPVTGEKIKSNIK